MTQPKIVVSSISDDIEIVALFRSRYWSPDDGIAFLLGIYLVKDGEDGFYQVKTLDGKVYDGPENKKQVDDLFNRQDLMRAIWDNSADPRKRYGKLFFIRWGLKNKDICGLSWLEDAVKKGLIPEKSLPKKQIEGADPEEKPLNAKSRGTLLKIIAGLTKICYKDIERGLKSEITKDFQELASTHPELKIDKDTLRECVDEAWKKYLSKELVKSGNP